MNGAVTWYRVGAITDIPPLGARVVRIDGRSIALFRTSDDRVFALLDRCPHKAGPLSQGIVHGSCVTCPLHDWVIDLESGEAKGPDEGRTERYEVRVDGASVLLGLPADAGVGSAVSGTSDPPSAPLALAR